jgi:hypothetical protein
MKIPLKQTCILCIVLFILLLSFDNCRSKRETSTDPVETDTLMISTQGGTYTFPEGIVMKVPAGAIESDMRVFLEYVDTVEVLPILRRRGVTKEEFLACLRCYPDGIEFDQPVEVLLSADLEPGDIPFVSYMNIFSGKTKPEVTTILCDPENNTIAIELSHFSDFAVELVTEFKKLSEECQTKPCRCIKYKVTQKDSDFTCSEGKCQITESDIEVTFPECENQAVEKNFVLEISEGCIPELHLTAGSQIVSPGGQTQISAKAMIGCKPLESQSVDFYLSGQLPATLNPTYGLTNADGNIPTTFTAGNEEGLVTVTARSTVSYYEYIRLARSTDYYETNYGPMKTESVSQQIPILIDDGDIKGTITFETVMFSSDIFLEFNYSNPVPFSIIDEDSIDGGGYMACSLFQDYGIGGWDVFAEGTTLLSGKFRNDSLFFDPPVYTESRGHVDMWAITEDGQYFSIIDADWDEPEGTVYFLGVMISPIVIPEEQSDERHAFKLPKIDGAKTDLTFQFEDGTVIFTMTLHLG